MPRTWHDGHGEPTWARALFTDRSDGDLSVALAADPDTAVALDARRRAVAAAPWSWLDQVHGADVVTVRSPGDGAGRRADALVTDVAGAVLAVHTADCAPVLFVGTGSDGQCVVGAAHAGWRGALGGVLERTVDAMVALGAERVEWRLGPCISPTAYEFGEDYLAAIAARLGPTVRSSTADGRPALDLRAAVRAALDPAAFADRAEVTEASGPDGAVPPVECTASSDEWFSWRARRDAGRQAALVWIEPAA